MSKVALGLAAALTLTVAPPAAGKPPVVEGGKLEFRLPDLAGQFVDAQRPYGDRGLLIVAIAFEAEEPEARRARLREFAAKQGINYLILDGGRPEEFETALPAVKNVKEFPVEILVDRLRRDIEALLSESAY